MGRGRINRARGPNYLQLPPTTSNIPTFQHSNTPTLYGLIGFPLAHSFSPAYFAAKFAREGIDACYEAFPLKHIEDLVALLAAHPELRGLNVTTPHKKSVIAFLDSLDDDAMAIAAVNCISIRDGKLKGHNTDWIGFRDSLAPLLQSHHKAALVLGTGGASQAVQYALRNMAIEFQTVSRAAGKADLQYDDITPAQIRAHKIIINTTTLGTEGEGCPALPYAMLGSEHLLYDLVYNPPLTPFLAEGLKHDTTIKNGQEMLERQAEASWSLWQQDAL